ncbi:hypothetical protein Q3G72_031539 [Acer saccharum]|nr:hypothetical protein Q3G72_024728 [Acer saccharum]KAK1555808.1 hypothetical protein Q3G72_031539 [Acer saccharum]
MEGIRLKPSCRIIVVNSGNGSTSRFWEELKNTLAKKRRGIEAYLVRNREDDDRWKLADRRRPAEMFDRRAAHRPRVETRCGQWCTGVACGRDCVRTEV